MNMSSIKAVLGALAALAAASAAAEGVLAQLYAPRPPAGSAFVRVVNPNPQAMQVQVGQGRMQETSAAVPASAYAVVKGGEDFAVRIDGKVVTTLSVGPDTFTTLVPVRQEDGSTAFLPLVDASGSQDAMKAQLRFYNLAQNCPTAGLALGSDGPAIFSEVGMHASAARSVNPVSAVLSATCGEARSVPLTLPTMQPGDHYSLFLTGSAAAPVLRGQASRTE